MNQKRLREFAELAVKIGANVQKGQDVLLRTSTETKELARAIVEEAYLAGARRVTIQWLDDYISRFHYLYQDEATLEEVPAYYLEMLHEIVDKNAALISITSPIPGLNADVDPLKMQKSSIATGKAIGFFRNHLMANKSQWTVVAYPNPVWAKQVFPYLSEEEAMDKLWDEILVASRCDEGKDAIHEWNLHNEFLLKHNDIMNQHQFKALKFKNDLGTDLTVELVKNHIWAGGGEHSAQGVYFNPNIPTEETFTMPYKWGTSGKVVSTKPLNYQGKLIEDFFLVFKEGKVVEFGAKKEQDTLASLLAFDEGSSYIGEIALISHDSPISNSNILFLNTLFDENASCHMALGRAYPMNVEGGNDMSKEELEAVGCNLSMVHEDFMFGSADMEIIGVKEDGSTVQVFHKGNFVI